MAAEDTRTARDRLDRILSIIRRSFRFWPVALTVMVMGGGASVAVAMLKPRAYKSETLILYREGIRTADLGGPESTGDPARKLGLKLKEMVFSRTSLEKVIKEFLLYPRIVDDRGYVDAVDEMRSKIAFRVKDGDTFGLSFEGKIPQRVQRVTARLADLLVGANTRSRTEQAEVTKEFLDAESGRAEAELKEKETLLARFLAKHPEFARETAQAAGGAGTAVRAAASRGSSARDSTLNALEREAGRIQERLGMPVRRSTSKEADPRLVAERQAADTDLALAQKDLQEKLTQFTEQHPDVRAAKTRVKLATDRLKRAQDAVASGEVVRKTASPDEEAAIDRGALESDLKKVQAEIAAYKARKRHDSAAQTEPVSGSAQLIVALETEWTRLNREVQEARERNQQLQDRQFKANMAESAAALGRNAQMVIVDPAYLPTHPTKLGRTMIVGLGVGASVVLAMLMLLGLALVDDRLYDRVDVERLRLGPLLAVVPRGRGRRTRG